MDMTRLISIVILVLHFYYYCYGTFYLWGLSSGFSDRLLRNITDTGLFDHFHRSKLIALVSNDIPDERKEKWEAKSSNRFCIYNHRTSDLPGLTDENKNNSSDPYLYRYYRFRNKWSERNIFFLILTIGFRIKFAIQISTFGRKLKTRSHPFSPHREKMCRCQKRISASEVASLIYFMPFWKIFIFL